MSLIPKTKIGVDSNRSKFHVPAVTHATSEIGYVIPTYSRSVIPNTLVRLGTRTGVRLSPLFVPTMGELEVRHYHNFIQYDKIWSPFDAFIARKPFTYPSGIASVPTRCPSIVVGNVIRARMTECKNRIPKVDEIRNNLYGNLTACLCYQDGTMFKFSDLNNAHSHLTQSPHHYLEQFWHANASADNPLYESSFGTGYTYSGFAPIMNWADNKITFVDSRGDSQSQLGFTFTDYSNGYYTEYNEILNTLSYPTFDNCDFRVKVPMGQDDLNPGHTYYGWLCYNFNGPWKRLRSIFMGLGYCFNPLDTTLVTPFKLLAFYRAYWSLFGVNRNKNFSDTPCCKLGAYLSSQNGTQYTCDSYSGSSLFGDMMWQFVDDLANCTYTTPADYFSSSVVNTQQGLIDTGDVLFTSDMTGTGASARATGSATAYQQNSNALSMKIAQRLLRFVNKYSVIGSKVSEILRARYGNMSIDDESSENVHRIGAVSTPVTIDAVYSNSETTDMPLGSYAGLGVGGSKNSTFTYETDNFGCFITITAVVPKMGYFQGMFRENSDGVNDANEFFNPEFDALAWQSVRNNELVADRQFQKDTSLGSNEFIPTGTNLGIFGYQPTYTHLKCAFNRVIGDISLPHMQDSMLPYTLDRFFKQTDNTIPLNEPQNFRAGTQGNTNRIFQVIAPTDDHVIMQIVFDVEMDSPMKSIATSYDTFDETTSHSIEVSHE